MFIEKNQSRKEILGLILYGIATQMQTFHDHATTALPTQPS
jgi:hypothetical protein